MSTLELPGLIGSNPLGALASFGLLRLLDVAGVKPRLHFVERDDWIAVLSSELDGFDDLSKRLTSCLEHREAVFPWQGEDVRVEMSDYRRTVKEMLALESRDPMAAERLAFLAALAADGAADRSKGLIKPTAFFMASGQQSFLDTLRAILARVKQDADACWREALLGPWRNSAPLWGVGWDPAGKRAHALRHVAPTREKTTCVPGAVWLGFEALPLFPSFSVNARERTVGFTRPRGEFAQWRWPLPTRPLGLATLRTLVASSELQAEERARDSRFRQARPGLGAIYESVREEFGQGYGIFRPARRVF